MDEETRVDCRVSVSMQAPSVRLPRGRKFVVVMMVAVTLLAPSWSVAYAQGRPSDATATEQTPSPVAALPDAPSATKETESSSFGKSLGTAVKTIGEDELHIIKSPFSVSALKWDALVVGATGVLIANDESVAHQVSPSWHNTSIDISNAGVYGLGAAAGGILVTGLITHDEHATDTGIRSVEASVDSRHPLLLIESDLGTATALHRRGRREILLGQLDRRLVSFGTRNLRLDARLCHGARVPELAHATADVRSGNRRQHNPCHRWSALPCRCLCGISHRIWRGNLRGA